MRSPRARQRRTFGPGAPSRSTRPALIAIAGGSGSGKSWLADKLERALQPQVTRISLDDFYLDRSHLPLTRRAQVNFDHPRSIDWIRLEQVLLKLLSMRSANVPCYDFATHSRLSHKKRVQPKPILLLEGLWPLRRASIRRRLSLSIFLDCPVGTRLRRRLARDLASRGRTRASVRQQFLNKVQPMHGRYVDPQKKLADLVFCKNCDAGDIRQLRAKLKSFLVR